MIGTGSAFSKRYDNNNALIYSNGFTLMVDCGITAPAALHRLGKTFADIDAVLVTHIHADHVGGLEEFAFQMKFIYKRMPTLYVPARIADILWEHTLKGGLAQEHGNTLGDFFQVRLLEEGDTARIAEGLEVEIIRTEHIPGKISYSLLFNGVFFYSADMKFNRSLLEELVYNRGVRTIFHDCQLKGEGVVHTTLEELLSLPEELQEKISLMHYEDCRDDFIGRTGRMPFIERGVRYPVADRVHD